MMAPDVSILPQTERNRRSNQLHLNRIREICPESAKKNIVNESLMKVALRTTLASPLPPA
ncbi:hypothetical protein [Stappia sp. MMSF_3263]|uniref:hypothetical protein n=1 Tax=Stappia sp. MMSF_3263 TaxID=3046693 RepID=UPI00273E92DC|nr:hypothetical protein [Stappia sp. MMSF_3263]